jgi:hypothetical protein
MKQISASWSEVGLHLSDVIEVSDSSNECVATFLVADAVRAAPSDG